MKNDKRLFMLFTLACVVAIGVCLIVNMAIDQQITWAAYPLLSVPFGWAMFSTLLIKKHGIIYFLCALTVLALPYLYLISKVTPVTDWFMPIGLPAALAGILAIWILFPLFRFVKMNAWYKAAFSVFLLGVVAGTIISYFIDVYLQMEPFKWYRYIDIFSCLVAAAALAIVGYKKSKPKSASSQS